jgi:trimethylamine:corrinoid methyltransferase-like protein
VRRRSRRRIRPGPEPANHYGHTPPYDPLSDVEAGRVVDATLQLMRETGIQFDPDPRVLDRFSAAGCDVDREARVRFDPELVRASLDSVAKSVRIWNRPGDACIEISNQHTWFMPGMTAVNVFDLETGERRNSTREDLAAITRVADALPDIDGVCLPCKIVERSSAEGEIEEFAVMAANTSKPLEYLCEHDVALEAAIELAAAVRGGADRLADKPYFLHSVTPLPLYYNRVHTDQLIRAVEAGVPVGAGTFTIGGASTPITIAGSLVHGLATDLAGIVLSQLVREGCFCMGSSAIVFMDPATALLGALPQTLLAELAQRQIGRLLGVPFSSGNGGKARCRGFGQETLVEASLTLLDTYYSRPATCDYLGLVDDGMSYSLRMLLLCHDLVGLIRCLWRGIQVDDETLALEVTRSVGPRGNYLAERHSADHCRSEHWASRYFHGGSAGLAQAAGPELLDRIDADLREILRTHRPPELPEPVREAFDAVLLRFGAATTQDQQA